MCIRDRYQRRVHGYALSLFVDTDKAKLFICCICHKIPSGASMVDHTKCGSIFCSSCITEGLKKEAKCIGCKETFDLSVLSKEGNRAVYNILQNLKIKCPFNGRQCAWIGDFADLPKHLKDDRKKYSLVHCPYMSAGCGKWAVQDVIDEHILDSTLFHSHLFAEYSKVQEGKLKALRNETAKASEKLAVNRLKSLCLLPGLLTGTSALYRGGNPVVFFDVAIDGVCKGALVMHLFANIVPKTVENFRHLCNGSFKNSDGKILHYKGTSINRIVTNFIFQVGDVVSDDGTGSDSIYGKHFDDENFYLSHTSPGILSMANSGPNTNGCQFFVTLKKCTNLDGKYVVFGEIIQGFDLMEEIGSHGSRTSEGKPKAKIVISNCGQLLLN
eukprot:TRINITY_DN13156_c0_g4_i1.p1 TRINITY_DN13156_c0_g4~~TRINITY_DN13156_c0_g4_i1.p1  ORF type:complete len:400 (+),score=51.90 TRINITY_DN13156_c0_g4_i1:48-1202(+)